MTAPRSSIATQACCVVAALVKPSVQYGGIVRAAGDARIVDLAAEPLAGLDFDRLHRRHITGRRIAHHDWQLHVAHRPHAHSLPAITRKAAESGSYARLGRASQAESDTANSLQVVGMPLSWCSPSVHELDARAGHEVFHGGGDQHLARFGE